MINKTLLFISIFNTAIIICLSAGNSLATTRYSKKYEIACKSCHSSDYELNSLGQRFRKNAYSFSNDDAVLVEKLQQSDPYIPNKRTSKTPSEQPAFVQGITDLSATSSVTTPVASPHPETIVYKRKTIDGTIHFSDRAELTDDIDSVPATERAGKKVRSVKKPLSAFRPGSHPKTTTPKSGKISSPKSAPAFSPDAVKPPVSTQRSYDQCVEQILISFPNPENPEDAVEQFSKAEESCATYQKMRH